MHTIENEFLKVTARNFGAELTSVYYKPTHTEHLWQADKNFWGWHAPVLFPVVGRCMNDEILIDGNKYAMEKHGFARKSEFTLLELNENKMVFMMQSSESTLRIYPYQFEFLIAYTLDGNKLLVSYEVINRDTKTIYFQLGGHPAFAAPFSATEKYDDYYLEFENTENAPRHYIDANGFFDGRTETALTNGMRVNLRPDLFKDDALIFKDLQSRKVFLKSRNHERYVEVDFNGFNYLGLWAKENAPYVCIEPWLGCAATAGVQTELSEKEGIISLVKAGKHNTQFTVSVH